MPWRYLLHYFILAIFISCHFPENDCFFDGLLTLSRKCLCIQWSKIILTLKLFQRLQTACSDLPNYLHKPSNCKNVIRLRKNSLFKASTDSTRKAAYSSSRWHCSHYILVVVASCEPWCATKINTHAHTCIPVYAHVHPCMPMYTRVCTSTPVYTRVCTSTPVYAHVHPCMYKYTRVCPCRPMDGCW